MSCLVLEFEIFLEILNIFANSLRIRQDMKKTRFYVKQHERLCCIRYIQTLAKVTRTQNLYFSYFLTI